MADSYQDKSEPATPKRRLDAREKGQIPKSTEVTTAFLLLAAGGLLWGVGGILANGFAAILGEGIASASTLPSGPEQIATMVRETTVRAALVAGPLLLGLAAAGGAIAAAQARGVLSAEPLKPDWKRIAPHTNAKRIWGVRAIAELVKSVLKLGVVGGVLYLTLRHSWSEIMTLGQQSPIVLAHWLGQFVVRLFLTAGATYLVIAGGDYAFQLWQHEKQLRMTKQEVKQELKETEGDPLVKSRMRTLSRALMRRQMYADVEKADVVVTNPTHIAIALKYNPMVSPAPIVLAMGQRKVAQRIKQLAYDAGVPVIEDRPLARALFAAARIGLPIPPELYVAVAEVLAFVFRRKRHGGKGDEWKGSASV
jgi:flagellar biosynthetic protein FlhB